jgi:hypothetical protein
VETNHEQASRHLAMVARHAVAGGLDAVAVLDLTRGIADPHVPVWVSNRKPLVLAGELSADEARGVATSATRDSELRSRLLNGDVLEASLGDRKVLVAIAAANSALRQALLGDRRTLVAIAASSALIVMVLPREPDKLQPHVVDRFRIQCDIIVARANKGSSDGDIPPPSSSSGGSSSGPAELPLIELGITIPRGRN